MSINYRTYVGPYVQCKVAAVEVIRHSRACTNPTCRNHRGTNMRGAFCIECGSAIGDIPYTDTGDAVNAWDVVEEIGEVLMTASGDGYYGWTKKQHAHIYVPNVSTPSREYHLDERPDFALAEITPEQVRAEVAQFEAQFTAEFDILRKNYGADAVTVHWGILQDYN